MPRGRASRTSSGCSIRTRVGLALLAVLLAAAPVAAQTSASMSPRVNASLTRLAFTEQISGGGVIPGGRPFSGGTVTSPIIAPAGTCSLPGLAVGTAAYGVTQSTGSLFTALVVNGQCVAMADAAANAFRPNSDATTAVGRSDVRWSTLYISGPAITQGAGTGITVNSVGEPRQLVYKVTVASTAFICAATTCDVTIATLPAKTFVQHALADLTVTFACAAVCTTSTLSATLGKTAGGNQYLLSFDADAATGQFGDAAAELGASLAPATIPTEAGDLASWTATTTVVLRLTSGTGNIGTGAASNLSQGSVAFYLTTVVMP